MTLPFVTLNHYTPSGFQTQDVVLKEDAEKLEAENKALFENNKELYAAGLAMRVENKRLRAALGEIIELGNPWSNSIAYLALEEPT